MKFEFHGEPADMLDQAGGYCQQIGKLYEYKLKELRKLVQHVDDESLRNAIRKEIHALSFATRELEQLGMRTQREAYATKYNDER